MKTPGLVGSLRHDVQRRGVTAWLLAAVITTFYVVLYFGYEKTHPTGLFEEVQGWLYRHGTVHLEEAGRRWLSFGAAAGEEGPRYEGNRWTVYGLLYTLAIVVGGAWVSWKYRHNRYQLVRTAVVVLVQLSFAFSVPILLRFFGHPEYYFSYLWPLKIDAIDPQNFEALGEVLVLYGFAASLLLVPVMTLLYGKRWYCSWVCGCGGLANTFGDGWRHLASTSSRAWRIEKVTVHFMLLVALMSTAIWFAAALLPEGGAVQRWAASSRSWYGWVVTAALSGAIGTGLYPVGGTRIWCRFFCPMAALLGLIQKLGRFRIRVKKDMCISCGLCSEYCEMGIDVRAYAQTNRSFTRASCVGCGLCAEVCPRGVLRLENDGPRGPKAGLTMTSFLDGSWKG